MINMTFIMWSALFFLLVFGCVIHLEQVQTQGIVTTQKLERLIAAAPNIGFNFSPNSGYQIPAANGIPITL